MRSARLRGEAGRAAVPLVPVVVVSDRRMAHREFLDAGGTQWTVWDVHPMAAMAMLRSPSPFGDGGVAPRGGRGGQGVQRAANEYVEAALAAGWLCFESTSEKRRLAPIPSGWETLPTDSLTFLCGRAAPVVRARRPTT